MQKQTLIGKRVAIWSKNFGNCYNGRLGTVLSDWEKYPIYKKTGLIVKLDEEESSIYLFDDELYFPDSPLGYNQPCFNQ